MDYDLTMKTVLAIMMLALPVVTQGATFDSFPGESMDNFIVRIAKDVSKLSRANSQLEICGPINEVDGRYTVTMTTGEKYSCEFSVDASYSGHSLHTHPYDTFAGFSEGDYQSGSGYMIWRGNVKHQSGKGTDRKVLSSR